MSDMFIKFIKPELLVLVPVLYIIGTFLKKSNLTNWNIPQIIGLVSIILTGIWVFASSNITDLKSFMLALFAIITQGILTAGVSVYANEITKKSVCKKMCNKDAK